MKEKLLNFIKPFLSYIDSGKVFRKPFSWLYMAFAALNAIAPFYVLYMAIDSGIFRGGAKFVIAFLLIWLFVLAACWVGIQIWWDRKDKVLASSKEGSEFPATPVIAHLIQTSGEWLGSLVAIVGFGFALITTVFLGDEAQYLARALQLPISSGLAGIVLSPVWGFLIIVGARFTAEMCRALAAIANNTKK